MSASEDSTNYLNDGYIEEAEEGSDDESSGGEANKGFMLREQDRFLPICNIIKIMKRVIPDNGKVAKDARECIQECVSEFISFITSEAIDRSHTENRKTVNGDDIIFALRALGFDNYVDPLNIYLHKYREATKSDRNLIYQDSMLFEDSNDIKPQQNGINSINISDINNDNLFFQNNQNNNFNL